MQPYIVSLNSNQRDISDPSVTTANFRIRLKSPITNAYSVELRKSVIANTSYVINNYNHTFTVLYSGTTYLITMAVGNYTAPQLATQLQSALASVPLTWTVTQNSTTNKFTITSSAACSLNFASFPLTARTLGFNPINTPVATSFTSANCYQANTTPYYYIKIAELPTRNDSGYFAVVMNRVDVGGYSYSISNDVMHAYQLLPGNIQQLSVSIYDSDGNPCDLNNGQVFIELIFHFC